MSMSTSCSRGTIAQVAYRMRGVGLWALSFDGQNQLSLFFAEDEQTRRLCLTKDAINNKYGPQTIQKVAIKYRLTHFLDRS